MYKSWVTDALFLAAGSLFLPHLHTKDRAFNWPMDLKNNLILYECNKW